ncbi:TetR/AcrR family transcriptional regulator [Natronogracilivirga saccharolytica]|uniref:TetR/AcrR family transcriptional regulator n=1 Tax=Natronogracilivirga saccharolytica TaxID=2812953 RepID=A0A8J7UTN4_9BACT|nr:TetR/AcrR family transcriptional regulator [Natronogracilivirga saccharolytica]MBP3192771.1 TetR/AcrR family transcriptional regulator [Natronogracilivirga saccharolytica]
MGRSGMSDELLEVAGNLFRKHGITYVTMDDISREMGISKKTLYKYYRNKEDLLYHVFKKGIEDRFRKHREVLVNAPNIIEGLVMVMVDTMKDYEKMNPVLLEELRRRYRAVSDVIRKEQYEQSYDEILKMLEKGKQQGVIMEEVDSDIVAKLFMAQTKHIHDYDLFPVTEYPRAKLFEYVFLNFLRSIITEKGKSLLDQAYRKYEGDFFRK